MSLVCVACGAENPDIDLRNEEKAKCHNCGCYLITAKSNPTWRLGNPKIFLVLLATVFATIIISFLTYGMIPGFLLYYLVYPFFVMVGKIPQGEEAWGLMVYGTIFSSPSLLLAYIGPYIWKPRKMDLITAQIVSFAIIPYSCLVAMNLYLYLRR